MPEEINNTVIGKYSVDLFITDSGKLGVTVTKDNEHDHCMDVFVDMEKREVHGG